MRRSANVVALLRRSAAAASCSGEHAAAALAGRGALWQAKSMSPTTMTINSKSSSSSSLFLRGFAADAAPEVDQEVFYPAQSAFVGCQAPRFTAPGPFFFSLVAMKNQQHQKIKLSHARRHFFFLPLSLAREATPSFLIFFFPTSSPRPSLSLSFNDNYDNKTTTSSSTIKSSTTTIKPSSFHINSLC